MYILKYFAINYLRSFLIARLEGDENKLLYI